MANDDLDPSEALLPPAGATSTKASPNGSGTTKKPSEALKDTTPAAQFTDAEKAEQAAARAQLDIDREAEFLGVKPEDMKNADAAKVAADAAKGVAKTSKYADAYKTVNTAIKDGKIGKEATAATKAAYAEQSHIGAMMNKTKVNFTGVTKTWARIAETGMRATGVAIGGGLIVHGGGRAIKGFTGAETIDPKTGKVTKAGMGDVIIGTAEGLGGLLAIERSLTVGGKGRILGPN